MVGLTFEHITTIACAVIYVSVLYFFRAKTNLFPIDEIILVLLKHLTDHFLDFVEGENCGGKWIKCAGEEYLVCIFFKCTLNGKLLTTCAGVNENGKLLRESTDRNRFKFAATCKNRNLYTASPRKIINKAEIPYVTVKLDFLDAVLCTHTHYDHADPWTLPRIAEQNEKTKFIIPAPEVDVIASYGIDRARIIPAYADMPIELEGYTVIPIPSAHEILHIDEKGNYHELGYIIDDGQNRIFHAGDMCMYDGLTERLNNIDVAILPINGRDYFRNANDIIGNFDSVEAVALSKIIKAGLLIPVHHDLYDINRVNPAHFVDMLMKIHSEQKYHIFVPGEKYIYAS